MNERLILVDADVLLWRASQGAQRTFDFGGGVFATGADYGRARDSFDSELRDIVVKLKATKVLLCLSDPKRNWRKELWGKVYKAHRPSAKPKVFWQLREHVEATYPYRWYPGLEGDDVLGLFATSPMLNIERVVVSIDKDLQTVPCKLYNPGKPALGIRTINEYDADQYHLIQTLSGDSVDGYKGCPGIGEKRAWAALFNLPHYAQWQTVLRLFREKGLGEDIALLNARVAHIMRYGDYDKETYKVKLWDPPSIPSVTPASVKSSPPAPSATPRKASRASTSSRRSSSAGSASTSPTARRSTATTTGSSASPSPATTAPPSTTSSASRKGRKTKTT